MGIKQVITCLSVSSPHARCTERDDAFGNYYPVNAREVQFEEMSSYMYMAGHLPKLYQHDNLFQEFAKFVDHVV